jgi:hypothetical protein
MNQMVTYNSMIYEKSLFYFGTLSLTNEIESDVVYLQNKTIGENHIQNVPSYKYRAWYKAYTRIEIGNLVSPKTDPGNYVVEANANLQLRAGSSIIFKPGTHFKAGSTVHAKIEYWPCHIDIPPPPPIIIDDPWGNGGGMLEPIPQEDENKCVLAQNIAPNIDQKNQNIFEGAISTNPENEKPNESDIDLKLLAIKENEVELIILQL